MYRRFWMRALSCGIDGRESMANSRIACNNLLSHRMFVKSRIATNITSRSPLATYGPPPSSYPSSRDLLRIVHPIHQSESRSYLVLFHVPTCALSSHPLCRLIPPSMVLPHITNSRLIHTFFSFVCFPASLRHHAPACSPACMSCRSSSAFGESLLSP
ncbi:hypothetical protein FA95DRAFT_817798 [Auriscalpium vulgare]|uniref:Uncharacterized protein n=1 Tax=Auriscalpium vulgare TaxID=40419 RepID=A0ACB8S0R0_9AGAM|nr:hypothetical protein FA95DRAFT_817798 [Auriscalpium vulgare]